MILRLSAKQMRQMADQLDAYTALTAAGADTLPPNTVIKVDGMGLAYANWWEDSRRWLAEIIDFTPGDAEPLGYHERPKGDGAPRVKPTPDFRIT